MDRCVAENDSVYAIQDISPVAKGHMLIIPKRHVIDHFAMSEKEKADADKILLELRDKILGCDDSVIGFNIGMNCGKVAGQTILHAHIHLIPRREGDTKSPRGGVRGVIPEKMDH